MLIKNIELYKKELIVHGDWIRCSLFLINHENFPRILETLIRLSNSLDFLTYKSSIYYEPEKTRSNFCQEFSRYVRDACQAGQTSYLFVRIIELVKTDLNKEENGSCILHQLRDLNNFLNRSFVVGEKTYSLKERNILYDYVCYILDILEESHIWNDVDHFRKLDVPIPCVLSILYDSIDIFGKLDNETSE